MKQTIWIALLLALFLPSKLAVADVDDDGDGSPASVDCDDLDPLNFPGNDEACDGQDNDCNGEADYGSSEAETWAAVQGTIISNSPFTKGTIMLASEDANLSGFSMYLNINIGEEVTLTVAEASAASGPYTVLAQGLVGGTGTPEFHELPTDVNLTAGMHYFFGGTWATNTDHYYLSAGANHNDWAEPSWGSFVSGAYLHGATPPADGWSPSSQPAGAYTIELSTGGGGIEVDEDSDGSWSCEDCDDTNPGIHPDATEVCDGEDNDCDPGTEAAGGESDEDGDGFIGCVDCNDSNANVSPAEPEICDGFDNNCDGTVDESTDADEDGVGICGPDGEVGGDDEDCDDDNPDMFPGNVEICDGLDNDCDPDTDELTDGDGDLFTVCDGDCDDDDTAFGPSADEICDGLDNNCDGSLPEDEADGDGDGYMACDDDCDDEDPLTYPGAEEQCDGVDNNCQGAIGADESDDDGDGFAPCEGDCDDGAAATNPLANEICDGFDNDCDGSLGEDEDDEDGDGYLGCEDDCNDGSAAAYPGALELCDDAIDNDCDGDTDSFDSLCEEASNGDQDGTWRRAGCSCTASATTSSAPGALGLLALSLFSVLRRSRNQRSAVRPDWPAA